MKTRDHRRIADGGFFDLGIVARRPAHDPNLPGYHLTAKPGVLERVKTVKNHILMAKILGQQFRLGFRNVGAGGDDLNWGSETALRVYEAFGICRIREESWQK